MGQELVKLFQYARDNLGLYGRFQLAMKLRVPSTQAAELPDDPEVIKDGKEFLDFLIKTKR
jgi:hypothetical protein